MKIKEKSLCLKKILTERTILNHKKLARKFIFLHISAFQRILLLFSASFRMFTQFDLLSTFFMSLHFKYQTNKCMLHVTVRAYIVLMQTHLHAQFKNVFDVCNLNIGCLS